MSEPTPPKSTKPRTPSKKRAARTTPAARAVIRNNNVAELAVCRRCDASILRGWDNDGPAIWTKLDVVPVPEQLADLASIVGRTANVVVKGHIWPRPWESVPFLWLEHRCGSVVYPAPKVRSVRPTEADLMAADEPPPF